MIYIIIFMNYIIQFININIFETEVMYLLFEGFNQFFSNKRYSFIKCWIHFYFTILQRWIHWSLPKFTTFIYQQFWKASVIVVHFVSFKEINYIFFLRISITHRKNLNPLKSAPHILSIKGECKFLFSNFIVLGLDNSSVSHMVLKTSFI